MLNCLVVIRRVKLAVAGVPKPFRVSVGALKETCCHHCHMSHSMFNVSIMALSDGAFLASGTTPKVEKFVQKWNIRFAQHGLQIKLNKIVFLKAGPN